MKAWSLRSGIPIGRIFGIEIRIHWTLILWDAIVLYQAWVSYGGWEAISQTLVWWLVVLLTILIHELGHCYFAYRQGGGADLIVLWPLGGLAYCDAPHLPRNQFWVAAGGPIFQLALTALVGIGLLLSGAMPSFIPGVGEGYVAIVLGGFFWWSLVLLAFNLVPLWPLDGGRMFQALVWGKLQSYGRATLATVWASRITGFTLLFVGIFLPERILSLPGLCIVIWALIETENLRVRLQSGEGGEDYVFGHDFSRGYTSLERTATRERRRARPSFLQRLRARARAREELQEAELRHQVDALLEKISREGMTSLSNKERKFLEWASKRLKRS